MSVYLLAIFHRSSLAVAGLAASERFHVSASQLATFAILQLLVYAAMQVPVGLLVDRYGPRTLLLSGLSLLTVAQTAFALATTYPAALGARFVVGLGDAMIFISVLRLISAWFPVRRVPLLNQLTGTIGGFGGILAAVPMTWALGHLGWTTAYLVAAAGGPVLAVALLMTMHDAPGRRHERGTPMPLAALRRTVAQSWAEPGTRLGFWIHFSTPFSATTLNLLWGYPFFVRGEGTSEATAGVLLTVIMVTALVVGPVLGWVVGRFPWHRSSIALGVLTAVVVTWSAVLLAPEGAPRWLLVALAVVVGIGGPTSMIGFDLGRTSNPSSRLASATGIVNQGGFVASLVLALAIGWMLDWRTPGAGSAYTPDAFRWAMSLQYVLWFVGLRQILRHRAALRAGVSRELVDAGVTAIHPPTVEVARAA